MEKRINKKAWIRLNDLGQQEKQMFLDHYKNKENVFILVGNYGNCEYKITNIDKENIYLEFMENIYR